MADPFLDQMKVRLDALQRELEQNPTYQMYEALRVSYNELSELWENLERKAARAQPERAASRTAEPGSRSRREGSKSAAVGNLVAEWFASTGRRAQSTAIVEEVAQRGVRITGAKPSAVMAAILSNDGRFDNARDDRGLGYGLKSWSSESAHSTGPASPPPMKVVENAPSDGTDAAVSAEPVQDAA